MSGGMERITIRAGTIMRPRDPSQKAERAKRDHNVLGLPSRAPGGYTAWSFVRGRNRSRKEYWYVMGDDVRDPEDFPEREGYIL